MKILVAGEAGQGKTTFINNMFLAYSQGKEVCVCVCMFVCFFAPRWLALASFQSCACFVLYINFGGLEKVAVRQDFPSREIITP